MLYDGRAEEAIQILDTIDMPDALSAMESDSALRNAYFNLRRGAMIDPAAQYRGLRQLISMALGNFERAVEVQTQEAKLAHKGIEEFKSRFFPAGAPMGLTMPSPFDREFSRELDRWYRPLSAPLNPVAAQLGGITRGIHMAILEQWMLLVRSRVEIHARLGLTYLEWGDIPSAIHHFKQADVAPESAVPFPAQLTARQYLKAIERGRDMSKSGR
jgi:hypothetical protein